MEKEDTEKAKHKKQEKQMTTIEACMNIQKEIRHVLQETINEKVENIIKYVHEMVIENAQLIGECKVYSSLTEEIQKLKETLQPSVSYVEKLKVNISAPTYMKTKRHEKIDKSKMDQSGVVFIKSRTNENMREIEKKFTTIVNPKN